MTPREKLWEAIVAFANHDSRWREKPNMEAAIDAFEASVCPPVPARMHSEEEARALGRMHDALGAARGYLLNAKFDLQGKTPRVTALRTIDGGLNVVGEALEQFRRHNDPASTGSPNLHTCGPERESPDSGHLKIVPVLAPGAVIALPDGRSVSVVGKSDGVTVGRDMRGRIPVRNVKTGRLSYMQERHLKSGYQLE